MIEVILCHEVDHDRFKGISKGVQLMSLFLFSCSVVSDCFATPRTVACQASLSVVFSRHEYWSGWPFTSLGDFRTQRSNLMSPALQVNSLPLSHPGNNS